MCAPLLEQRLVLSKPLCLFAFGSRAFLCSTKSEPKMTNECIAQTELSCGVQMDEATRTLLPISKLILRPAQQSSSRKTRPSEGANTRSTGGSRRPRRTCYTRDKMHTSCSRASSFERDGRDRRRHPTQDAEGGSRQHIVHVPAHISPQSRRSKRALLSLRVSYEV